MSSIHVIWEQTYLVMWQLCSSRGTDLQREFIVLHNFTTPRIITKVLRCNSVTLPMCALDLFPCRKPCAFDLIRAVCSVNKGHRALSRCSHLFSFPVEYTKGTSRLAEKKCRMALDFETSAVT